MDIDSSSFLHSFNEPEPLALYIIREIYPNNGPSEAAPPSETRNPKVTYLQQQPSGPALVPDAAYQTDSPPLLSLQEGSLVSEPEMWKGAWDPTQCVTVRPSAV